MSNISYSKINVIIEAARNLLVSDNSNTGLEVREIHYYCSDRIYRTFLRTNHDFPQIVLECEYGETNIGLPSGEYLLRIIPYVKMDDDYAKTKLSNITARVIYLLDNQPDQLNLATSKSLRCRLIAKMSSIEIPDLLDKMLKNPTVFRIVCDDEVLIN